MRTRLHSQSTSTIVDLAGFRRPTPDAEIVAPQRRHAHILSLRQHLHTQASVEIDDIQWMQAQFNETVRDRLVQDVRALLNAEFGCLRVSRYRRLFVVRHRTAEGLVAGLLRVQYHAHQVALPRVNVFGDTVEQSGLALTWGVGHTSTEAEIERLKRRRQKNNRR